MWVMLYISHFLTALAPLPEKEEKPYKVSFGPQKAETSAAAAVSSSLAVFHSGKMQLHYLGSNMALGVDASPLAAMHRDSLGSSVHFAIKILSQRMRLPGGGKAWGTEVSQALSLHSPPTFKNAANIFWLHSYSMLFSSFLPAKYSLGCLKKLTCLSIFKAQGTVQEI